MATLSDWQTRKSVLDSQIMQLGDLVNMYEKNTRSTSDTLKTIESLQDRLGQVLKRKQDAESSAATFDREFIERKQSFPDGWKPSKLGTMQDFVTFFFFVSYIIFVLALTLTFPGRTLAILVGAAFASGVVIALMYSFA